MMQPCSQTTRAVSSTRTSVSASFRIQTSQRTSASSSRAPPCEPTTHRLKITFRILTSVKLNMKKRNRKGNFSARVRMVVGASQAGPLTEEHPLQRTTCTLRNSANSSKKAQSSQLKKRRRKMSRFAAWTYPSTKLHATTSTCITNFSKTTRVCCRNMINCSTKEIKI